MKRLTMLAALFVGIGCAAPMPTVTSSASPISSLATSTATAVPTANSVATPTDAATTPSPHHGPTPPAPPDPADTINVWDWIATCGDIPEGDCMGVAKLFINNLAWGGGQIRDESGGRLAVEPRPDCPPVPDWADSSFCWQATAVVADGEVCIVIARQLPSVSKRFKRGFGFGQVGGDLRGTFNSRGRPQRPACV